MRLISTICLGLLLVTCQPPPTLLEQILDEGTLRVVSRNSPTTYYFGPEGPVGPEYDLASGFAEQLGVELDMTATDSIAELLGAVASGEANKKIKAPNSLSHRYYVEDIGHGIVPFMAMAEISGGEIARVSPLTRSCRYNLPRLANTTWRPFGESSGSASTRALTGPRPTRWGNSSRS